MFPAGDPGMERLQRALHWSWPAGRVAGIPVRIRWTVAIVFVAAAIQLGQWSGVGLSEALLWAAATTLILYLVILSHELGHAMAAARERAPVHLITLSAFGGLAHGTIPVPGPKAEIRVSLAGPAVHLVWAGLAWVVGRFLPPVRVGNSLLDVSQHVLVLNLWLLAFNLLPLYPMDGGRVLRAVIALRRHPNEATLWACRVGILGGVAIAAWGLSRSDFSGTILFVIGLSNAMTCMQEMVAARYTDGPYGPGLDPWATDPDAWKAGRPDRGAPREERLWPRVLRGRGRATPRGDESSPSPGAATATLDAPASRT
ncbi:MAG TPA: site-2 protease family protein, partial [Planctomycetota bacterium]|nr:site-2 protease family protein [Planctomycetota bacterium]